MRCLTKILLTVLKLYEVIQLSKTNIRILDNYKSFLSKKDVAQYKEEITKIKNKPVCSDLSTMDVIKIGVNEMEKKRFRLIKGKFDV